MWEMTSSNKKTSFGWSDFCKLLVYHLEAPMLVKTVEKPFIAIFRDKTINELDNWAGFILPEVSST